jgi:hypothetical protein
MKIRTIDEWPLQPCPVCGDAMRYLSVRMKWEGEYEFQMPIFECRNACQVSATVTYRQWVGAPGEIEEVR